MKNDKVFNSNNSAKESIQSTILYKVIAGNYAIIVS